MNKERTPYRKVISRIVNFALIGLMILLLIDSDAKSWFLKQMVSTGLFNAEIKNEPPRAINNPSFTFIDAEGKPASTTDLKGKVIFINFWATWCPPCRAEMPSLQSLYNKFRGDDRIVFLFVNEDDDIRKAYDYLKQNGYSFPQTRRSGSPVEEIFSGTLPTTVIMNKAGNIVYRKQGLANYNSTSFVEQLKALL